MSKKFGPAYGSDPETARAVLEAALYCWHRGDKLKKNRPPRSFITMSHQPGSRATEVCHQLVERLNQMPGGDWTAWDSEVFDEISFDPAVEAEVAATIDAPSPVKPDEIAQWVKTGELCSTSPLSAYERVATTLRALAMAGHTLLVGCGGQLITAGMPNGIHVRLITPFEYQVQYIAKTFNLTRQQAESRVKEAECNRQQFYRRTWPEKPLAQDAFSLTLNAAVWSTGEMVECVLALIKAREVNPCCADKKNVPKVAS